MSKHLRRPQSPRSRVVVLGAVVLAAASVTTATMALGQAGGTTSGAVAAEQAPAAAVSPAGQVSMIVTAFAGARATAPVASAAAVPGFTPPTTGSGVDGARRVTAVGLRVRHLPPARPGTAARSQVAN